jgi:hypothetical protein
MITIGVISDTHISGPTKELCRLVQPGGVFEDAALVLHAGDMVHASVLDAFLPKDVAAVRGNMDGFDARDRFPSSRIVEAEGFRIAMMHGWGSPEGLEEAILSRFENVDAVVYGHTHRPANRRIKGVLVFNPGSFSSSALARKEATVGILTLSDTIEGRIVPFGSPLKSG